MGRKSNLSTFAEIKDDSDTQWDLLLDFICGVDRRRQLKAILRHNCLLYANIQTGRRLPEVQQDTYCHVGAFTLRI